MSATFVLTDLTDSHFADAVTIWTTGWADAHLHLVPKELAVLRTHESFEARLRSKSARTTVAIDDTGVLGVCIVNGNEVDQFYVAPRAQGSGVAQALMHHAEETIRTAGHRSAWLACTIGNTKAARFYEKCGWINVGATPVQLETAAGPFTLDIWRFEKQLVQEAIASTPKLSRASTP